MELCNLNFYSIRRVFEHFQEILLVLKELILNNQEIDNNIMKLKENYEDYMKYLQRLNDDIQFKYNEFNRIINAEKDFSIRKIMVFGALFSNLMEKISENKGFLISY